MSIPGLKERCKAVIAQLSGLPKLPQDVLILAIILLASSASFGLGYMAGREAGAPPISIEVAPVDSAAEAATSSTVPEGEGSGIYVASKNGTKYYLPSCSGAKRISEANKVWFTSVAAAAAAGYAPAANCKGL